MKYELVELERLIPLEEVFPSHLENIRQLIYRDGEMHKALIADRMTGTILDGSHRYAFLLEEGYKLAPVYWVNYQDENIRVGSKLAHRFLTDGCSLVNKSECIRRSSTGELFSPRTTRHFFPFRKNSITVSLTDLKPGPKRVIDHLLAKVNISEEISHNKSYLAEIDEELRILSDYIAEMVESRTYLTTQVDMLKASQPVIFFPGKFHPPHMGHVQTILQLASNCKKLIIGVTGDTPSNDIMTQNEIIQVLSDVLETFDNIEVLKINDTLTQKNDTCGLPRFDLLCSGNPDVISWAEKQGVKAKFVERSLGVHCSGEVIRTVLSDSSSEHI